MIAFDRPASTPQERNVLGGPLVACSREPLTGFFRDGCCRTGPADAGVHTVCAVMTKDFLEFTVRAGNDLVTPQPQWGFPGLVVGDRWCLCAARWLGGRGGGACAPGRARGDAREVAVDRAPRPARAACRDDRLSRCSKRVGPSRRPSRRAVDAIDAARFHGILTSIGAALRVFP